MEKSNQIPGNPAPFTHVFSLPSARVCQLMPWVGHQGVPARPPQPHITTNIFHFQYHHIPTNGSVPSTMVGIKINWFSIQPHQTSWKTQTPTIPTNGLMGNQTPSNSQLTPLTTHHNPMVSPPKAHPIPKMGQCHQPWLESNSIDFQFNPMKNPCKPHQIPKNGVMRNQTPSNSQLTPLKSHQNPMQSPPKPHQNPTNGESNQSHPSTNFGY